MPESTIVESLFKQELRVVNVGLASFAESIQQTGGGTLHVEWSPPARSDREIGRQLAELVNRPDIEQANQQALERLLAAQPVLRGVASAREALPGMGERMILHAGPPVHWDGMCGPMQGAIVGAILYEGWVETLEQARSLAASGEVTFEPCHHHHAVGPMAGVISPTMPVWIVENTSGGNRAFSNLNEGLGKVLRFGANEANVIERLRWMRDVLGPAMRAAVDVLGGVELKPIIAQALHMGDECHNRNGAATSLLFKRLTPALLKTQTPIATSAAVLEFIAGNDHFFLNLSMAACKAMLDAAHGVRGSSLVTVMARNGVEFGVRVSGLGDRWFTAPAPIVEGLFFPGYSMADAAPDLGDSAITETCGLGGFAMGTAPAIAQFVGGTPQDAIGYTRDMAHITLGVNNAFTLPPLGFSGTPCGIDARKVVDTGIAPVINTGIAHRAAGIGQIGAGITRAPLACFEQAVSALATDRVV
ncbi:MAG: oxamate carbamoyltransferase subunit AllG family protein [Anaerolineales bacterium]